jgi:hypothetical protein
MYVGPRPEQLSSGSLRWPQGSLLRPEIIPLLSLRYLMVCTYNYISYLDLFVYILDPSKCISDAPTRISDCLLTC